MSFETGPSDDCDCPPAPAAEGAVTRELRIVNKKGLHARATAKFVQCAERFDADVTVSKDGQTVSGSSIMGLMMLGAAKGDSITIHTRGDGADAALLKLVGLVKDSFGED